MANTSRDLSFNVAAIDRTARSFEKIALRLERLEAKLDKLDRKRVDVDVDVDTDRATRKVREFADTTVSASAGAFRIASRNGYLVIAAILLALAALPPAAAIAASGVVLAFGAGLAGIGIAAAAQDKKVRKTFSDLKGDIGRDLRQISKPFEGTLHTIAAVARDVYESLNLGPIFEQLAPAVSQFARHFGAAFKALAPALGPITTAFAALLDKLGPQLEPLFASIGAALTDLADVVNDNADIFAAFIAALLHAIPLAIRIVAALARAFAFMYRNGPKIASAILGFVKVALRAMQFLVDATLTGFGLIINGAAGAFGWIPGIGPKLKSAADKFNQFADGVHGVFDDAIAKVDEWQKTLDKVDKVIKLQGDIQDLEGKLAEARRKLKDPTLTKAQRKEIRGDIRDLEDKLARARARLAELKPATVKQVKGNIRDLESKLATAKQKLRDPALTRAQTKRIRGNIRDLQAKIEKAKAELASIRDRTVYVNVVTRQRNAGGHPHTTTYYPGRAAGGPVLANRSYLVGERGPEILQMGRNSGTIVPNRKVSDGATQEIVIPIYIGDEVVRVVREEISETDRSTKRRALAGTGANR